MNRRVRVGNLYTFNPNGWDLYLPAARLTDKDLKELKATEGGSAMEKKNTTGDYIVDALIRMGKPLTVENWMSLNYWNRTRESLCGEELAELERLIEAGLLVDTKSECVN